MKWVIRILAGGLALCALIVAAFFGYGWYIERQARDFAARIPAELSPGTPLEEVLARYPNFRADSRTAANDLCYAITPSLTNAGSHMVIANDDESGLTSAAEAAALMKRKAKAFADCRRPSVWFFFGPFWRVSLVIPVDAEFRVAEIPSVKVYQ